MPDYIQCTASVCRYESRGFFKRLFNMIEAFFRQQDVNHITGDVHYLTLLLRKHKTVLTVLDCGGMHRLSGLKRRIYQLFWLVLPVWRSAFVSTISEFSKAELIRYACCSPNVVQVIPVPVAQEFTPMAKPFNREYPNILQVGSTDNKNIERVAEALAGVPCHLEIIGRLSLSQIAALDRFRIDYSCEHGISAVGVHAKYCACDMVIFASTFEGFGMPIIEANAIGRPVVTSDVASMPEVAGGAACLVNPLDTESIRRGILRLIQDDAYRQALIDRGYVNAKRFNTNAIASQYVQLYEDVLDHRLRRRARGNAGTSVPGANDSQYPSF